MDKHSRAIAASPLGQHEALHVAYIMADMFEDYLLEHPAIRGDKALKKQGKKVLEALYDFYQAVGSRNYKANNSDA